MADSSDSVKSTPKRKRTRLAKSEVWLHLAMSAERWATEREDDRPESDRTDPLLMLCTVYGLTTRDLARLLRNVAQEAENRAMRLGYEEAWTDGR